MHTVYVVLTVLAAALNACAAAVDFVRAGWVLENMTRAGVPHSWVFPLGVAKAAGAVGLLVGLAVPALGIAAAVGLVLYYVGAIVTVVRARWPQHVPYPAAFLLLAAGTLAAQLAV
jgi:hypothetical protein